jgi:hypothetical protein
MVKEIIKSNINSQFTGELAAPLVCTGSPGTGKSSIIKKLIAEQNYNIVNVSAATFTIEEAGGLPEFVKVPGFEKYSSVGATSAIGTKWSVSELIVQANTLAQSKRTVILLDDLHAMPLATMTAMYELLLERKLKQFNLDPSVAIICTANDSSEADWNGMPSPIINRLQWLKMPFNPEAWYDEVASKFHPMVSSYLKRNMDKVQEKESTTSPYATPRAWEYLSTCIYNLPKGILEQDPLLLANGFVSNTTAISFAEHVEYLHKLDFESDIKSQNIFKVADKPFLDQVLYGNILTSINTPEDAVFMVKFLDHNFECDSFIGFFAPTLASMFQRKAEGLYVSEGILILINLITDKPLDEFNLTKKQQKLFADTPLTKRKQILSTFTRYLI